MSATQFAQHFAAKAAKVNPSAPSTTKWNGVRALFAEELGLEPNDVYVTTLSKPGNATVRFGQSAAALSASVLVGMHTDSPAVIEQTINTTSKIVAERNSIAAVAMREAGDWIVVAVLAKRSNGDAASIARCYPDAVVLSL